MPTGRPLLDQQGRIRVDADGRWFLALTDGACPDCGCSGKTPCGTGCDGCTDMVEVKPGVFIPNKLRVSFDPSPTSCGTIIGAGTLTGTLGGPYCLCFRGVLGFGAGFSVLYTYERYPGDIDDDLPGSDPMVIGAIVTDASASGEPLFCQQTVSIFAGVAFLQAFGANAAEGVTNYFDCAEHATEDNVAVCGVEVRPGQHFAMEGGSATFQFCDCSTACDEETDRDCYFVYGCTFNCAAQAWGPVTLIGKVCNAVDISHDWTSTGTVTVNGNKQIRAEKIVKGDPCTEQGDCTPGATPDPPSASVIGNCMYRYRAVYNCNDLAWGPVTLVTVLGCTAGATEVPWHETARTGATITWETDVVGPACTSMCECEEPDPEEYPDVPTDDPGCVATDCVTACPETCPDPISGTIVISGFDDSGGECTLSLNGSFPVTNDSDCGGAWCAPATGSNRSASAFTSSRSHATPSHRRA
jgi:hypothetical protein